MGAPPFDERALLDEARDRTGLSDFGDESFREPLGVLLESLAEAPLNAVGAMVWQGSIGRSLSQRLLALDWLRRHPEIAEEPIERPLVVVGMMRSGTTLLQRLLARDPRLRCALGWEIGEPAPRPGTRWDEPDPRIADAEVRMTQMRQLAPDLHAIHPTGALEADEEILFLADAFLSHVPEASCHVPVYRAWIDDQDFTPAYRWLRTMLQLLQWQKRQRGETGERWVLKTPAHLGYLDTLLAVFPDAHLVHVHRHPLETIPSGASLNLTLWRLHADAVDPTEVGRQWLERASWANARALDFRRRHPEALVTDVEYRDEMADPFGTAESVLRAAGLEPLPEARAAMEAWRKADAHPKRPVHRYTLEQFGLSEAAIRDAFADYVERFVD